MIKNIWVRLSLILIVLLLATLACTEGGDGATDSLNNSGSGGWNINPEATATYGAEQFEIQLTAIANQGK